MRKKAAVFTLQELIRFCEAPELNGPYWEVRKTIAILAYFGGLRFSELLELELERFTITSKGFVITHERAKQRSDKSESCFPIPKSKDPGSFDFADFIAMYLNNLKEDLSIYTGRLFWMSRADCSVNVPMGRNMVADIPQLIATYLEKPNAHEFTCHSFRRSSVTAAADARATPVQMIAFFIWKGGNMPNEYISSSHTQVNKMANKLANGTEETEKGPEEAQEKQTLDHKETAKTKDLMTPPAAAPAMKSPRGRAERSSSSSRTSRTFSCNQSKIKLYLIHLKTSFK